MVVRLSQISKRFRKLVVVDQEASDDSGTKMLKIADPSAIAGNTTSIGYSALVNDYRPGATWDQTYFTAAEA
jgi:hypothetical protein